MNLAPQSASLRLANPRKQKLMEEIEASLDEAERWRKINEAYHADDIKFMRFLIPPGKRVLELGCGTGELLAALEPSRGVGIDFSTETLARAKARFPHLDFVLGDAEDPATLNAIEGPFDYIVIADTIGMFEDIDGTLRLIYQLCTPVDPYRHFILLPSLGAGAEERGSARAAAQAADHQLHRDSGLPELDGPRRFRGHQRRAAAVAAAAAVRARSARQQIYRAACRVSGQLCLRTYLVGRPVKLFPDRKLSASILIPCRNERGNIENAVLRMPRFGSAQEILFVEGNSSDGTFEECERVRDAYKGVWDITVLKQEGKGKGDAVRKGFAAAKNDVLMILDADLTMPPEALPKYHAVIESGKADFVNGTRLVYPMENEAMRPLNFIANRCFAYLFSYLVNTRLTDTLCGTKVLMRRDYEVLARERGYFGNFDPFGDFDLIFGAAKQNLKIIETPIHYKARTFGETQISRFRDGWLLLKMVWFAYRKLKAI